MSQASGLVQCAVLHRVGFFRISVPTLLKAFLAFAVTPAEFWCSVSMLRTGEQLARVFKAVALPLIEIKILVNFLLNF